jgi:hypothetical protein
LQHLCLVSFFQQKQAVGVAAWREVQPEVIAQGSASLNRIVLMPAIKLLKALKNIFTYQITILQPPFFPFCIANAFPPLPMLKHNHTVAIANISRFGKNGSDSISQKGLWSGDIQDFFLPPSPAAAGDKRSKKKTSNNLWERISRKELHD